jgi:hypothetical protein
VFVPAFAAWASPARLAPKPTLNQHSTRTTQWGLPIAELDEFLEVASAALPRITEIIVAFPAEHRAGALEVAERRYRQAARDFGCTEADSERWVAAVMRKLRTLVEQGDRRGKLATQVRKVDDTTSRS